MCFFKRTKKLCLIEDVCVCVMFCVNDNLSRPKHSSSIDLWTHAKRFVDASIHFSEKSGIRKESSKYKTIRAIVQILHNISVLCWWQNDASSLTMTL